MPAHPQSRTKLLAAYRAVIPYRPDALFQDFLPKGYALMTLSSVPEEHRELLLASKLRWGMFITLLDDFADNPRYHDPRLLEELHRTPFTAPTANERPVVRLARNLIEGALEPLRALPSQSALGDILRFDIEGFLSANRYSSLLTACPELANPQESAIYGPHNMGMMAIGMMDLMALPHFEKEELGKARAYFHLGQRFGRICNVLVTADREDAEGDVTGELAIGRRHGLRLEQALENEANAILAHLRAQGDSLRSFSLPAYVESLESLRALHERLRGTI